jgi:hypothetical protein
MRIGAQIRVDGKKDSGGRRWRSEWKEHGSNKRRKMGMKKESEGDSEKRREQEEQWWPAGWQGLESRRWALGLGTGWCGRSPRQMWSLCQEEEIRFCCD